MRGPEFASLGPRWTRSGHRQFPETVAARGQALPPQAPLSGAPRPLPPASRKGPAHVPTASAGCCPPCIHSMGLGSRGPSRVCGPPLASLTSALALSHQESRNQARPG